MVLKTNVEYSIIRIQLFLVELTTILKTTNLNMMVKTLDIELITKGRKLNISKTVHL